jgi:hypothetical protein
MTNSDANQQWDLFSSGPTFPLLRVIEQWATEDGVEQDVIIKRLASLLIQSNEYVMVWKNLTIPDPNVANLLEKYLKQKTWKGISADAYDRDLLKSFHGGIKELGKKLDAGKKKDLLVKDLSVDCDTLYEVISKFGLPVPSFLKLIVGEPPGKPAMGTVGSVAREEPSAQIKQPFLSVKDFCDTYDSFKEGGIRHYIFHENSNGLAKSGGVVRIGGKVLINVEKFFEWANKNGKN